MEFMEISEIENDVFNSLMYQEGKQKRPIGFGLGVKESDIFGVSSFLRKRGSDIMGCNNSIEVEHLKTKITKMEVVNEAALTSLKMENQELRAKVDQSNKFMLQALTAIHNQTFTSEFMEAAHSAFHPVDSQFASTSAESEERNPKSRTTR